MLTIHEIEKTYEGQPLLKKVSFTVQNDETVCLLGSSGSGKSTLLRIIAGLEQAEGGQVTWDGEDLTNVPVHQREFGLMFQDYALFPHRNVSENIAFGLRMQGLSKEEIQGESGCRPGDHPYDQLCKAQGDRAFRRRATAGCASPGIGTRASLADAG